MFDGHGFRWGAALPGEALDLAALARSELTAKAFILERSRDLHDRGSTSSYAHEPALVARHMADPTYLALRTSWPSVSTVFGFSCGSTDG
jgi:hypothetical protein